MEGNDNLKCLLLTPFSLVASKLKSFALPESRELYLAPCGDMFKTETYILWACPPMYFLGAPGQRLYLIQPSKDRCSTCLSTQ